MSCIPNQRERIQVTTPPAELPVTLDEVKAHLGLTGNDTFDSTLTMYIEAWTDWAQKYTGTFFVTQTISQWLDWFPVYQRTGSLSASFRGCYPETYGSSYSVAGSEREITLYATPVQSVEYVRAHYEGSTTDVDASDYYLDIIDDINAARIIPVTGYSWPTDTRNKMGCEVSAVVGYGAQADVPSGIKQALINLVGYQFNNRVACGGMSQTDLANASGGGAMLAAYRRVRIYNGN